LEGEEPGYNVFNLLGAENRLATPGRRHALCWIHDAIRWHQGLRVDAARIVDPQAQRRLIEPAANSGKRRREIALLMGVADWRAVAQKAKPPLAIGHQRASAGGIAGLQIGRTLQPFPGNLLLRISLADPCMLGKGARHGCVEEQRGKPTPYHTAGDTGRDHVYG